MWLAYSFATLLLLATPGKPKISDYTEFCSTGRMVRNGILRMYRNFFVIESVK